VHAGDCQPAFGRFRVEDADLALARLALGGKRHMRMAAPERSSGLRPTMVLGDGTFAVNLAHECLCSYLDGGASPSARRRASGLFVQSAAPSRLDPDCVRAYAPRRGSIESVSSGEEVRVLVCNGTTAFRRGGGAWRV